MNHNKTYFLYNLCIFIILEQLYFLKVTKMISVGNEKCLCCFNIIENITLNYQKLKFDIEYGY